MSLRASDIHFQIWNVHVQVKHDHVVYSEGRLAVSDSDTLAEKVCYSGRQCVRVQHTTFRTQTLVGPPLSIGPSDAQHISILGPIRVHRSHWQWVVRNHSEGQAEARWRRELFSLLFVRIFLFYNAQC